MKCIPIRWGKWKKKQIHLNKYHTAISMVGDKLWLICDDNRYSFFIFFFFNTLIYFSYFSFLPGLIRLLSLVPLRCNLACSTSMLLLFTKDYKSFSLSLEGGDSNDRKEKMKWAKWEKKRVGSRTIVLIGFTKTGKWVVNFNIKNHDSVFFFFSFENLLYVRAKTLV